MMLGLGTVHGKISVYRDPVTGETITEQWDEPSKSWVRITPIGGGPSQNVPPPPGFVPEEPPPGGWLSEADYYSTEPPAPPAGEWFPGIPNIVVAGALGLFLVLRMAK